MAFLWDQRQRLLREEGWNATELAKELFAMFSPDVPDNTRAPISIDNTKKNTVSPITFDGAGSGTVAGNVTINKTDGAISLGNAGGSGAGQPGGSGKPGKAGRSGKDGQAGRAGKAGAKSKQVPVWG